MLETSQLQPVFVASTHNIITTVPWPAGRWVHCSKPDLDNSAVKCLCPICTTVTPSYFCCLGSSRPLSLSSCPGSRFRIPITQLVLKVHFADPIVSVTQEQWQQHRREPRNIVCSKAFLACWPKCSSSNSPGIVRLLTVEGFAFRILQWRHQSKLIMKKWP